MSALVIPFLLLVALVGCSPGVTVAPTPAPVAVASPAPAASPEVLRSPRPATLAAVARFGAISSFRVVPGELQVIYDRFDNPATKNPGTATSYYVVMGEVEYAVHYDHADKVLALQPGQTVNLHPSGYGVCFIRGDQRDCRRLMLLYPGSKRQDPLGIINAPIR